jgi:hypothetical protein
MSIGSIYILVTYKRIKIVMTWSDWTNLV